MSHIKYNGCLLVYINSTIIKILKFSYNYDKISYEFLLKQTKIIKYTNIEEQRI